MRVIINADDLGISEPVNDAIFDLMRRRLITSATVMANGAAVESAARRLRELPHCSFGVHLNLTNFASLSRHPGFGECVDDAGIFRGNIRRIRIDGNVREAVVAEWKVQIERVLALGVPVSHLDSHHHVHTIPKLFGPLKQVQKYFGVRKIRISHNLYRNAGLKVRTMLAAKAAWNFALRHYGATQTTDRFTGLADFHAVSQQNRICCRTIELMVHPGDPHFDLETQLLDGAWREHCQEPIELISYKEL
jgi:predicted glycoside hydrolase/deacetylase ChbG (UPF0249 family)